MRGNLPAVRTKLLRVLLGNALRDLRNACHKRPTNRDLYPVRASTLIINRPQAAVRKRLASLPNGCIVVRNAACNFHVRHVHLLAQKVCHAAIHNVSRGVHLGETERPRVVAAKPVSVVNFGSHHDLKLLIVLKRNSRTAVRAQHSAVKLVGLFGGFADYIFNFGFRRAVYPRYFRGNFLCGQPQSAGAV